MLTYYCGKLRLWTAWLLLLLNNRQTIKNNVWTRIICNEWHVFLSNFFFIISKHFTTLSTQIRVVKNCSCYFENQKYYTVGIVPKSNGKIVEVGKIGTPNTHIYMTAHVRLGTGTTIKSG